MNNTRVQRFISALVFTACTASVVLADTLPVPDEYPTIQAAIDAAFNGDTVLVADGTYTGAGNRDLDFGGKAITVACEEDPADCVIDVGASYGYFGIVAGNVIEREAGGSVHLIDANPRMAELAAKSLEAAGLGPLGTVTDRAVSDTEGEIDLRVPAKHWGQAHLDGDDGDRSGGEGDGDRPEPVDEELVVPVPTITLDRFAEAQGIDRVDLVKLNIEGHEAKAYQGMTRIIDQNRDRLRLLLAFSPERYRDAEGFFEQIKGDFKFVYGIGGTDQGSTELCTYDDLTSWASGPATLLATNSEFCRGRMTR